MKPATTPSEPKGEKRSRVGFWLSIITAGLVLAGMLILTLLPYAMEWAGERALLKAGAASAAIGDVDFNPVAGRLIVTDLLVSGVNGDSASVERLLVKVDLFPLFRKRIYIHTFDLLGVNVVVRQGEGGEIAVGGIAIPSPSPEAAPEPDTGTAPSLGFGVGDLNARELVVRFLAPERDETLGVERFRLRGLSTWEPEKSSQFSLRAEVINAAIDLEGEARPLSGTPWIRCDLNLRNLSLRELLPYLANAGVTALSGAVQARGFLEGTLYPGRQRVDFNVTVDSGDVAAKASYGSGDGESLPGSFSLQLEQATLKAGGSFAREGSPGVGKVNLNSQVILSNLALGAGNSPEALVRVGSARVDEAVFDDMGSLVVPRVSLEGVHLLERASGSVQGGQPGDVVSFESIRVEGIDIENMSRVKVGSVRLDTLNAWIQRNEGDGLEAVQLLSAAFPGAPPAKGKTTPGGAASSPQPERNVTVGTFSMTGENRVVFRDLDARPPFQAEIDTLSVRVLELDTLGGTGPATVSVKGGMGKYATFGLDGTVHPPWDRPDVNLQVRLAGIDLPPLTPYTNRYLGYILKSGHLEMDLDAVVDKGDVSAQAEIVVNRIDMDPVKEEDAQRAEDRLGIPVKTALSLLKDKNDDIKLTLPIEGNLDDPQFKTSDVILAATGNALKKGVSAYYGPLGATLLTGGLVPPGTFSLLGKIFSGVTTMSFDPVLFDPLDQTLSAQSGQFLDQVAEKLAEKPDVRLILCGKVSRADIDALRRRQFEEALVTGSMEAPAQTGGVQGAPELLPDTVKGEVLPAQAGTPPPVAPGGPPSVEDVPLSDEEKELLLEVAKQRALAVRDHLAEKGGLDPERLFVCYSDVETKSDGPPPRVDLSI